MFRVVGGLILSGAAVLAACTTTVSGQGSTAGSGGSAAPGEPVLLEFRKVSVTEPSSAAPGPAAPATPEPAAVDAARAARQRVDLADSAAVRSAIEALDCAAPDPLRGNDDPKLPLVTCDRTAPAKYALEPAFLGGTDVAAATAKIDPNSGRWIVEVSFSSAAARTWADFTTRNVGQQVAIVVDAEVVSAPTINEGIVDGNTVISGSFTREDAQKLAASLTR